MEILPWGGVALLAACSDKSAAPAATPAPSAPPASAASVAQTGSASAPETPPTSAAEVVAPAPTGKLPMVSATDTTALALGYSEKATQVDAAKYPKYAAGQACANCVLFGGKAGDAAGPCPLYAGKQVSAQAWCSAYTKKTG